MARRKKPKTTGSTNRGDRPKTDRPTVMSAAGLLAFYEEEDALIKIRPIHVVIATVTFIAAVVLLTFI